MDIKVGDKISIFEKIENIDEIRTKKEWYIAKTEDGFPVNIHLNRRYFRFNSRPLAHDILNKNFLEGNNYKVKLSMQPTLLEGKYEAYCLIMGSAKTM
jgi:hypothetical protein